MVKLKWRVQEKPTGRYRSFHKRGWPTCSYVDDNMSHAGHIAAVDGRGYVPREAEDVLLEVWVACRSGQVNFTNLRMTKRFKGLKAAKAGLEDFIQRHPEHWPVGLRD